MSQKINDAEVIFSNANRQFIAKKLAHRVEAVEAALIQKRKLKHLLSLVNADLKEARKGNFKRLVEQYVSVQVAEEYE